MNRIDRISAILIHLQSRRVVRAQDIAERFEISLRTVYRDIRALEQAGIPIIGEAGSGYSLAAGYRLPPVMLTGDEALALLTAEKLVSHFTDEVSARNYGSAMFKIKAVLDDEKKALLHDIDDKIEVFTRRQGANSADAGILQQILTSVNRQQAVEISYEARYNHTQTQRLVEPIGVFYTDQSWHLIAFCRLRNDYRDFRLDRITSLQPTPENFSSKHIRLKDYLASKQHSGDLGTLTPVVIRVLANQAIWLDSEKYYHGFISEEKMGGEIEMSFMTSSLSGFARWYSMFGDFAAIVKPAELKQMVIDLQNKIRVRLE